MEKDFSALRGVLNISALGRRLMRGFVAVVVLVLGMSSLGHAQALASDSDVTAAVVSSSSATPHASPAVAFHQDGTQPPG